MIQKARPALILNRAQSPLIRRACCVNPEPGGEVSQNSRSSQHIVVRWVMPYGRGSWEMEQCQAGKEPANRLAEVEYGLKRRGYSGSEGARGRADRKSTRL